MPWFLPFCYGTPAPDESMVAQCRDINEDSVNEMLNKYNLPFSHVKQFASKLTDESKAKIARTDKLDQVLWYV